MLCGVAAAAQTVTVSKGNLTAAVTATEWNRPYSRETAAFPDKWTRASKFWPAVGRVDNVYGDRNLVCSCVGMEAYAEAPKA